MTDPESGREQAAGGQFSGRANEEMFGRAQTEQRFGDADARIEAEVAATHPNATDPERESEALSLRDGLGRLLEADSLKLVRVQREDHSWAETVEPEDSETPVDGMPLETFSRLFGVDEHAGDDELAEVLSQASGKRFRIETMSAE